MVQHTLLKFYSNLYISGSPFIRAVEEEVRSRQNNSPCILPCLNMKYVVCKMKRCFCRKFGSYHTCHQCIMTASRAVNRLPGSSSSKKVCARIEKNCTNSVWFRPLPTLDPGESMVAPTIANEFPSTRNVYSCPFDMAWTAIVCKGGPRS